MMFLPSNLMRSLLILLAASWLCGGCSKANPDPEIRYLTPASHSSSSDEAVIDFSRPPSIPALATGQEKPPTPAELKAQLGPALKNWFYGPGLGRTAANVSTAVLFPPYLIYLVGNAGLTLVGAGPLYVTDALPEQPRQYMLSAYEEVTGVPGRLTAAVAREDYCSETKSHD